MTGDIDTDAIWADIEAKVKKQQDAAAVAATPAAPGAIADQTVAKLRGQTAIPTATVTPAAESATGDPELDAIWAKIQAGAAAEKQAAAARPTAAQPAAPLPSTWSGVGKNAVAGVTDGVAGIVNLFSDPSGTLGNGLANLAVSAHDLVNPYIGKWLGDPNGVVKWGDWQVSNGQRFTPDQRSFLLGAQVPEPGNALVDKVATTAGLPAPSTIPANGPAEELTRKVIGGGTGAALIGPGAIIPTLAGTVTGDLGARLAPDWAKPGAETLGNLLGAGVTGKLQDVKVTKPLNEIDPNVAKDAALARDTYGIQLLRPQINETSAKLDKATAYSPLSGQGSEITGENGVRAQWQRAVAKTIGDDTNSPNIDDGMLKAANTRIGSGLDHFEANTTLHVDQPMINALAKIEADAQSSLTDPEYRVIRNQITGVLKNMQNGDIDGQTVSNLISHKSPLSMAAARANDNIAGFAQDIKTTIQDALGRSMTPDDFADYSKLRQQYKNLMTLRPLVAADNSGNISPSAYDRAVRKSYGDSSAVNAYPGQIPAVDLARIGRMVPEPSASIKNTDYSGLARWGLPGLGAADQLLQLSGLTSEGHWIAPGVAAGALANRLLGSMYLRNPGAANRLIDQTQFGYRPVAPGRVPSVDDMYNKQPLSGYGQSLLVPSDDKRGQ